MVSVEDLPAVVIAPGNPDSFTFTVTLSEKPAAFDKAKISVDATRATVDSVIALPAIAEDDPRVVQVILPRSRAVGFIRIS